MSDSVFSEKKEENAEIAEIVEDAPAEEPAPVPAPAPTLETVQERPHTPSSCKIPKSDQFSGQVAQSKVAYPNLAPLDVSPSIVNYLTFKPFWYQFPIFSGLVLRIKLLK